MLQQNLGTVIVAIPSGSHEGSIATDSSPVDVRFAFQKQFYTIELCICTRQIMKKIRLPRAKNEAPDQHLSTKSRQNFL